MKALICFTKKELMAQVRSAKFYILLGLFVFFGLLNPLLAKLIPLLFEILEETMEQTGIDMPIAVAAVTDLDSWGQFFANATLYTIIFVIMQGNIFTKEYGNSTLVMVLTKGLDRWKVVCSKAFMLFSLWTFYYLIYFITTYIATALIFETHLAQNLAVSAIYLWLAGLWICAIAVFFSVLAKSMGSVIAGALGIYFLFSLFEVVPKIQKFLPTGLIDGTSLVYGMKTPGDYIFSLIIALVSGAVLLAASFPIFNKKQI